MNIQKLAFLLFLIPNLVNAQAFQYTHLMLCDQIEIVVDNLTNKYGEKLQWSGKDKDGSGAMLFENSKEKTWSLIKFNNQYACVYGVGEESKSESRFLQ